MTCCKKIYFWIYYIIWIADGYPYQWHYLLSMLSLNNLSFPNIFFPFDNSVFQLFLMYHLFYLQLHTPFVTGTLIFELKKYLKIGNDRFPRTFFLLFIFHHDTISSYSNQMEHINTVKILLPYFPALVLQYWGSM